MSTRVVTSRAADVNPPSTQSSPLMTTPLASNRAIGPGVAAVQVKVGTGTPASAASVLDPPASGDAARSPMQAGAAGPGAVRADEEQAAAAAISPTAKRSALATAASLPASQHAAKKRVIGLRRPLHYRADNSASQSVQEGRPLCWISCLT